LSTIHPYYHRSTSIYHPTLTAPRVHSNHNALYQENPEKPPPPKNKAKTIMYVSRSRQIIS